MGDLRGERGQKRLEMAGGERIINKYRSSEKQGTKISSHFG